MTGMTLSDGTALRPFGSDDSAAITDLAPTEQLIEAIRRALAGEPPAVLDGLAERMSLEDARAVLSAISGDDVGPVFAGTALGGLQRRSRDRHAKGASAWGRRAARGRLLPEGQPIP